MNNLTKFIRYSSAVVALAIALPAASMAQGRQTSRPAPSYRAASRPSSSGPSRSTSSTPRAPAPAARAASPRFTERSIPGRPGFVTRTYVSGGRSYVGVYRMAAFRGIIYPHYVPGFFYAPGFYGWVLNPWPGPIVFSWGFYGAPWFGFYGPYFAPAPVYVAPELWLTDYVISENLKAAYEARASQAAARQPDSITPEMKALIAGQVRQELEAERRESQAGPHDEQDQAEAAPDATPEALAPSQKVFVVSMNLNVTADGKNCSLNPGDLIIRSSDKVSDPKSVGVMVVTSKAGSCAAGSKTTLDLATLQEMHNDFRQKIDSGLATLAENQGKRGLPKAPAADPKSAQ
jgi:hypothetical protein